jgi:hypothetical protein
LTLATNASAFPCTALSIAGLLALEAFWLSWDLEQPHNARLAAIANVNRTRAGSMGDLDGVVMAP